MNPHDKLAYWLHDHSYDTLSGWPYPDGEPLDIENLQVVSFTDDGVEFCCGGDWQDPQRLRLTPGLTIEVLDGKLEQMPAWDTKVVGEWPGWLE